MLRDTVIPCLHCVSLHPLLHNYIHLWTLWVTAGDSEREIYDISPLTINISAQGRVQPYWLHDCLVGATLARV